ncbi:hypothetical protein CLIBASIA_00225 [Candidatus Liberibacter asiaticus str. psy62]|uniref:Uncharacterized protein n=1 Tax=Liberibacter asiaticus (strain psy62) TaxID=537021 RepID=C6XH90_LIBAP|nr:hypothetical protein CLIBASIA_00225 [Candidatus Liberibacter asiaticus str. psy62]BAP25920.1 hypothetical protein CGUJ_00225 [Candidatus Liberibacter asiaticus str. Ishi-1]
MTYIISMKMMYVFSCIVEKSVLEDEFSNQPGSVGCF